jgi:hypothetical protein
MANPLSRQWITPESISTEKRVSSASASTGSQEVAVPARFIRGWCEVLQFQKPRSVLDYLID